MNSATVIIIEKARCSVARSREMKSPISPHQDLLDLLIEAQVERAEAAVLLCIHATQARFSTHIQQHTGLSQTDVSKATCRLSERGLIEHELVHGTGPGRPRKRFRAIVALHQSVDQLIQKERLMIEACEQNIITMQRWVQQAKLDAPFKEG